MCPVTSYFTFPVDKALSTCHEHILFFFSEIFSQKKNQYYENVLESTHYSEKYAIQRTEMSFGIPSDIIQVHL